MSKLDGKKAETRKRIYADPAGFQSIKNTLIDLRKVDPTIREAEVKEWIENNAASFNT